MNPTNPCRGHASESERAEGIEAAVRELRLFIMGESLQTRKEASKHLETLVAECDRLTGIIANPMLHGMNIRDGAVEMALEGPGPALLAGMFVGLLDRFPDAQNYVECSFSSALGPITVTVQKPDGKTPHALRVEAETELAASRAECARLSSMLDHQRDEAIETERMLRAELASVRAEPAAPAPSVEAPAGMPCEIAGADFEAGTVALKMNGAYEVRAGLHYLVPAGAPVPVEVPMPGPGEDTKLLEWMQFRGARVEWSSDDEYCCVIWSDRDDTYRTAPFSDWREAIRAAIRGDARPAVDRLAPATPAEIFDAAQRLIARAQHAGVVLTIETVSIPPWAMGRYTMRASTRPARHAEYLVSRVMAEKTNGSSFVSCTERLAHGVERLRSERIRQHWDFVCALAPDDHEPFESSVLGHVYWGRDSLTGQRVSVIPQDLRDEACEHGFEILAADAERNTYTLRRIRKEAQR